MARYKKFVAASAFLLVFAILLLPTMSFAYSLGEPLVPPCGQDVATDKCGWNQLLGLVNNVITFALVYMTVPIAAIMFAYAGFLMVTAGEEASSAKTKAKDIFLNTVVGLVLALAAWLIVKLLLGILGWEGGWIGF